MVFFAAFIGYRPCNAMESNRKITKQAKAVFKKLPRLNLLVYLRLLQKLKPNDS